VKWVWYDVFVVECRVAGPMVKLARVTALVLAWGGAGDDSRMSEADEDRKGRSAEIWEEG